jgi:peroxiredoxin Q/BCP
MKISRSAMLQTISYVFCLVALLVLVHPMILAPAIHADDQVMPAVGVMAPDFALSSQEGTTVNLHDFRGKWVVLYFYPKDASKGCTIEAHAFQRDLPLYDKKNAVVLGVSVDTVESHKEWCAKDSLTFKLLSDADKKVSTTYGSTMSIPQAPQMGVVAARNTFLINPNGKIVKEFVKVNPTGHSEEVLAALDELQKDAAK